VRSIKARAGIVIASTIIVNQAMKQTAPVQNKSSVFATAPCRGYLCLVRPPRMTCPHCSQNFQLIWSRYARSFLGRHTCPHCGKQSTFRATLPYIALLLVAWGIVFAAAIAIRSAAFPAHAHARPTPLWFAAVFALGSLVLLPLDKFYDARFRKLRKLRCDTHAP